jgi:hypothetical protein
MLSRLFMVTPEDRGISPRINYNQLFLLMI